MESQVPANALCIGCNYPLHALPELRCPECGRTFDPSDSSTFNTGRPLTWFTRLLIGPIGAPTFLIVTVLCARVLYFALDPTFYYLFIAWFHLLCLWGLAIALLGGRVLLRQSLADNSVPRSLGRTRLGLVFGLLSLTTMFVLIHVPLRIEFLIAKPGLEKWVRDIREGKEPASSPPRKIGVFTFHRNTTYGDKSNIFFNMNDGGGFAYKPSDEPMVSFYNSASDGHLFSDWYWWTDD